MNPPQWCSYYDGDKDSCENAFATTDAMDKFKPCFYSGTACRADGNAEADYTSCSAAACSILDQCLFHGTDDKTNNIKHSTPQDWVDGCTMASNSESMQCSTYSCKWGYNMYLELAGDYGTVTDIDDNNGMCSASNSRRRRDVPNWCDGREGNDGTRRRAGCASSLLQSSRREAETIHSSKANTMQPGGPRIDDCEQRCMQCGPENQDACFQCQECKCAQACPECEAIKSADVNLDYHHSCELCGACTALNHTQAADGALTQQAATRRTAASYMDSAEAGEIHCSNDHFEDAHDQCDDGTDNADCTLTITNTFWEKKK
jgi:hypothetical protein